MSFICLLFELKIETIAKVLLEGEIQTIICYPIPLHKQKAFSDWNNLTLPITEKIHKEVLSLPMSSITIMEEVDCVIEVFK